MFIINQCTSRPIYLGAIAARRDGRSSSGGRSRGFFATRSRSPHEVYAMTGRDREASARAVSAAGPAERSFARATPCVSRASSGPWLGFVVGAAGYARESGGNTDHSTRRRSRASRAVFGWRRRPLAQEGPRVEALYAEWVLRSREPDVVVRRRRAVPFPDADEPVPTRIRGGYARSATYFLELFETSTSSARSAASTYDTKPTYPTLRDTRFRVARSRGTAYVPCRPLSRRLPLSNTRPSLLRADDIGFGFMY